SLVVRTRRVVATLGGYDARAHSSGDCFDKPLVEGLNGSIDLTCAGHKVPPLVRLNDEFTVLERRGRSLTPVAHRERVRARREPCEQVCTRQSILVQVRRIVLDHHRPAIASSYGRSPGYRN